MTVALLPEVGYVLSNSIGSRVGSRHDFRDTNPLERKSD